MTKRQIEQAFEHIADDVVKRCQRVDCTLEELQRGIGQIHRALATIERIIAEERLRS